jgi:natural product biosynthesis luciferase-like monooxygenase protein/amino acid adenylation domain-containing protein
MSKVYNAAGADSAHKEIILSALKTVVNDLTGIQPENVDIHANFLEVGIDSLTLIQATQLVKELYDVKLSVVQLLEQLTNLDALASYITQELPPEALAEIVASRESSEVIPELEVPAPPPTPPVTPSVPPVSSVIAAQPQPPAPATYTPPVQTLAPEVKTAPVEVYAAPSHATNGGGHSSTSGLDQIMSQQLQVMAQQLEMLHAYHASSVTTARIEEPPVAIASEPREQTPAPAEAEPHKVSELDSVTAPVVAPATEPAPARVSNVRNQPVYIPYQPIEPGQTTGLTEKQQQHLNRLIARFTSRTRESKRLTQESRPYLSDSRSSFGFRLLWKELVYPLIADHSSGSKVWDVDGNEYLDISMGFGIHLFGHSPAFLDAAMKDLIDRKSVQLGPQVYLAGKVARLFSDLTGQERVNFCNSGTEAVMAAMRLARTVTRRSRIAIFAGAYHGWSDLTSAKVAPGKGESRSVPIGPGISARSVEDVIVLDWDSPTAIEYLKEHVHELAAVMVEPVQSRRPDIQPRAFLHQLRELTAKAGTALIFDEMITGFRIHTGGAQAWFGVQADIATYGKVIGGGLPIGVIAGKAAFLDAFDGGMWNYGDDSYPQAVKTLFAGAFFKHPLTMAAAQAVLHHLRDQPSLLPDLNDRTARLVAMLNQLFAEAELPVEVVNFASLFRFMFSPELKFVDLFFYHMLDQGIYIWEGRNCFLSTAHSEEDLSRIVRAVANSVAEMRAGGFWPGTPGKPQQSESSTPTSIDGNTGSLATAGEKSNGHGQPTASSAAAEPLARPAYVVDRSEKTSLARAAVTGPKFSLSYFGNYQAEFSADKYELLFEGAKYADQHGFEAVWIPERHFHAFGGFSPNPSVVAAALARETRRVRIHAGSVVLPLHNPIRVAEEWSVVDNLSHGRIGISFASGWQPNDFVFAPEAYATRHEHMYRGIDLVQRLWRGEKVPARSGDGKEIEVGIAPMPMQRILPTWVTGASPVTFKKAGELGTRVLTNLQDQSIEDLAEKIAIYHTALERSGYDPAIAHVTLLLHTFVSRELAEAREKARHPLYRYMKSSLALMSNRVKGSNSKPINLDELADEDLDYILSAGYERYAQSASLIGTTESCMTVVDRLASIGVTEIACMIDFGVDTQTVLDSLRHLNALREQYQNGRPHDNFAPAQAITTGPVLTEPVSYSVVERPVKEVRSIPLTDAQRQLWITTQIGPDASRAFNESVTLRMRGPLDVEAMRLALQRLVERHELLRATFSPSGEYQVIHPVLTLDIPLIDFSQVDEVLREAKAEEWITRAVGEPFDLETGPLVRFRIIRMAEDFHLVVFNNHHLVADGQSWGVLLADLHAFYAAARRGVEAQLAPAGTFDDFIQRQRRIQAKGDEESAEEYWVRLFADSIPVLNLPTDRPRPPVRTYNGKRVMISTGPSLFKKVRKLCAEQGSTVYMMLLAAYSSLLHRLSRQEKIIVGVPAAGQVAAGSKDTVGYCINLLLLLSDASNNPTFGEYLNTIKRRLMESLEHQQYSFGALLKQLNIPWDASRSPLFSTTFNVDRSESARKFFDLEFEAVPNQTNWATDELRMSVIERDDELIFDCIFNSDLFEESTVRRWLGHLQTLLESITENVTQPFWHLPMLSDEECRTLLSERDRQRSVIQAQGLHELFERQVDANPQAIALEFGWERLSYAELNRRANALAGRLREAGVTREVFVGLCAERSIEAVVGMLGVLKAGGAYVHIDPTYPPERIRFLIDDTRLRLIVSQRRWLNQLSVFDCELSELEEWSRSNGAELDSNDSSRVHSDQAAYVYYTSGSTGNPKGVITTHGAAVNFLNFVVREYGLSPEDVVLQVAALTFDASVRDILGPLAAGARVILPDETDAKDPAALIAMVERHCVSCFMSLVPTRFSGLIEAAGRAKRDLTSLRLILLSGEHLPIADCRRAWEIMGDDVSIVNQYGPTECTMISTFQRVSNGDAANGNALAGSPIDNTQLYILDEHLELSPLGVPGEVFIGGKGLARGYLNRPDLTAEKFIAHPYANEPGARLYRTGDLARLLPAGQLEILGRLDHQIKFRGVRIEPAEIEAVLAGHPRVHEAVVIQREDAPNDKRLVAYVTAGSIDAPFSANELRAYLRERLPEYMEPSAFVFLDELPLTRNGKVNRQALPAPDMGRLDQSLEAAAPRNATERQLAELWCEVLMIQGFGINDDFFELGGNSLLGTQLLARIRDTLGIDLPLRSLFERPTIAGLGTEVEEISRAKQSLQGPRIEPVSRDMELPLSFAQQRLWFIHQLDRNSRAYNVRAGIRLRGELNVDALRQSINEIVRRHEVLRTRFTAVDGRPIQVIEPSLKIDLPVIDLREMPAAERERRAREIAIEEAERLFDLEKCPLLRLTLLQLDDQDYALAYCLHHIIADGWSMGILVNEISRLYMAFSSGVASPLPELSIQYADFAYWQQEWLQGEVLDEQLSYWKKQLENAPAELKLPTDHPRPAEPTFRGARQTMVVPAELAAKLHELSRQEGVTLFMTLLAAFQVLLSRYTGQNDIVVGSDIANRNISATQSLIGFFVNQIVLRTDVSDNPDFFELLQRVRDTALEAYAHQDLPFEKLVEAIQPERHLNRAPLFQVKFLLQNTPQDAELSLRGITLHPFNFDIEAATFDLLLSVFDTEQGLRGTFEYNTDLFEADTIERLGQHFNSLLESIVANPRQHVADISFLSVEEQQRLLVEWNDTSTEYANDKCIHELFEEQVERTPNAIAAVFDDEQLTYAELNARANQLGHYLIELGVKDEMLVGLCVEKSLDVVVGMLGILKAGGAFLPLDSAYPLERLSFMLEDAQVSVLLTQQKLAATLPTTQWVQTICLDSDWDLIAEQSKSNTSGVAEADHLAYVIYTSGSTGRPKGVMVGHSGLCNMVTAQIQAFDVRSDSRVLQLASLSFDASVSEIFMALLAGGALYIGHRDSLMPGPELIRALRENEITTVTLPPSVLTVMESEGLETLKTIIAAGESCPPETAERWAKVTRIFDAYGPTEITVCATLGELDGSRVTIGKPIANTSIYILDANLQLVPGGIYGELHVGGAGLARGYWNRPELTAERFIPNPFVTDAGNAGQRLYKTGDLARWLDDGTIEFAGRIDNQLKVRGYRIEAGEIETLLNSHPEVRTSVVIARESGEGEKHLIAYWVPQNTTVNGRIELWPSVAEFYIYDDLLYHAMTADERRNQSYKFAINRHVKDKIVLDIGTGKDAILARFCVAAGAARVYAIELLEDAYKQAKSTIESLGLTDRIILIHGNSMEVELPEKIDVCVSEIVGPIGGCEGAAPIINNAWRFMQEDGVMIPARSVTRIAAITLPDDFLENPGFSKVSAQYVERVFEEVGHKFDLRLCLRNFSKDNIISNYQPFEDLDFSQPIQPEFKHEIELTINREANMVGFVAWLNLHTVEDEVINILEHEYCWLPVYLPVFYPGVEAAEGDYIRASVSGTFSDNNLNLDYTVKGKLFRHAGDDIEFDYTTCHHEQIFQATKFHEKIFADGGISTLEDKQPQALSKKLRTYLQEVLPDYMVPSQFMTIDTLPLTPNGKVDRRALPAPGQTEVGTDHGYVAPRNALESQLASIWEELLGVRPVGIRESFFELGGHSLSAVRLMAKIKKHFGMDLPISALFRGETVEEFAEILGDQSMAWRSSPLVPIQPQGTRPPFFCVHALGGNVNNYYLLAQYLGSDQPFYGLQAPPLHEVTEAESQIELMAARYVEAIREVQTSGPYRLGGYSFGSFVAYEMARQLRDLGEEVALLALFDTYSPAYLQKLPETRDLADNLVSLAWSTSREQGKRLLLPVEFLRQLNSDEQLRYFLEKMWEENLAPPEVDEELLRRFLYGSTAREGAARRYAPQSYPGTITVLKCEERDQLWIERLVAAGLPPDNQTLGWGELSAEPVNVFDIAGHHDVICQEPYVQTLAERLRACLEAASVERKPLASAVTLTA